MSTTAGATAQVKISAIDFAAVGRLLTNMTNAAIEQEDPTTSALYEKMLHEMQREPAQVLNELMGELRHLKPRDLVFGLMAGVAVAHMSGSEPFAKALDAADKMVALFRSLRGGK